MNHRCCIVVSLLQIQEVFDVLLEVLQLQQLHIQKGRLNTAPRCADMHPAPPQGVDEEGFLHSTCRQLLDMPFTRKGRYLPLSSLIKAKGATWVLEMQPDLVRQTLLAMQVVREFAFINISFILVGGLSLRLKHVLENMYSLTIHHYVSMSLECFPLLCITVSL